MSRRKFTRRVLPPVPDDVAEWIGRLRRNGGRELRMSKAEQARVTEQVYRRLGVEADRTRGGSAP
jgi:hypothetical protein